MKPADLEVGSGNVFRDLDLPDADELAAKADLAIMVGRIIDKRRLTQKQAAVLLGIDQPKVSAIVRGHLEKFSFDRLAQYLMRLGCDVDIGVREKNAKTSGRMRVSVKHESPVIALAKRRRSRQPANRTR